jgi:hypothetical protein
VDPLELLEPLEPLELPEPLEPAPVPRLMPPPLLPAPVPRLMPPPAPLLPEPVPRVMPPPLLLLEPMPPPLLPAPPVPRLLPEDDDDPPPLLPLPLLPVRVGIMLLTLSPKELAVSRTCSTTRLITLFPAGVRAAAAAPVAAAAAAPAAPTTIATFFFVALRLRVTAAFFPATDLFAVLTRRVTAAFFPAAFLLGDERFFDAERFFEDDVRLALLRFAEDFFLLEDFLELFFDDRFLAAMLSPYPKRPGFGIVRAVVATGLLNFADS